MDGLNHLRCQFVLGEYAAIINTLTVCKQSSKTGNFSPQTIQHFSICGVQSLWKNFTPGTYSNNKGIFCFVGRHYM